MTDEQAPEPNTEEAKPEPPPETRTIDELIEAGYVGFLTGSDGSAIVDPKYPDEPDERDKLKWRFDS